MLGLTFDETDNPLMQKNYARNYDKRQRQIRSHVPDFVSNRYKRSLRLRFQRIRDMCMVCRIHSASYEDYEHDYQDDFKSTGDPEFIQECKRKEKKYFAEMNMLMMAFPFLSNTYNMNEDDI